MGWTFELKNANIVAYLTSTIRQTPRIQIDHLNRFLFGVSNLQYGENRSFISSDPNWGNRISEEARKAINELYDLRDDRERLTDFEEKLRTDLPVALNEIIASAEEDEYGVQYNDVPLERLLEEAVNHERRVLQPPELDSVLLGLRYLFRDYKFFVLAVGQSFGELVDFARHIAIDSGGNALILIPEDVDYTSK